MVDPFQLHPQTLACALHLGDNRALSRTPNVKGEAQKVKGFLLNVLLVSMFGERHQSCLLFIELQPILRKALDECFQDAFGVALILAADNGVIRITEELRNAL